MLLQVVQVRGSSRPGRHSLNFVPLYPEVALVKLQGGRWSKAGNARERIHRSGCHAVIRPSH